MNTDTAPAVPVFMDHAEWRLIVYIGTGRLAAYMARTGQPEAVPALVVEKQWDVREESDQLRGVEEAVYSCPSLLDDFEADIVLHTSTSVFVPTEALSQPGDASLLYAPIRELSDEDIFECAHGELSALCCPAKGLRSFLDRTFPGARVAPHLAVLENYMRRQTQRDGRLYVNIDEKSVDVLAFRGENLLCAASHEWHDPADVVYYAFLTFAEAGFDGGDDAVIISGQGAGREEAAEMMRRHVDCVVDATLPRSADAPGLPLAVALLAARKTSKEQ